MGNITNKMHFMDAVLYRELVYKDHLRNTQFANEVWGFERDRVDAKTFKITYGPRDNPKALEVRIND